MSEEIKQQEQPQTKKAKYGTREQVFNGLAERTKGKLSKDDIVFEKGKYKSKRAVERGRALIAQLKTPKS